LKEDPHLQGGYDEARVLFSARTFTPFHAFKLDHTYATAFLPNSFSKIKNKSLPTMSRHSDLKADQVRRDLMSYTLLTNHWCSADGSAPGTGDLGTENFGSLRVLN